LGKAYTYLRLEDARKESTYLFLFKALAGRNSRGKMSDDEEPDVGGDSPADADMEPNSPPPEESEEEKKEGEEDEGDEKKHEADGDEPDPTTVEEKTEFLDPNQMDKEGDKKKEKLTPKYMTKYERARILGVRAFQICLGAPVMVQLAEGEIDPLVIALKELKERKIPITIRRFMPDGTFEDWTCEELTIDWGHDTRRDIKTAQIN